MRLLPILHPSLPSWIFRKFRFILWRTEKCPLQLKSDKYYAYISRYIVWYAPAQVLRSIYLCCLHPTLCIIQYINEAWVLVIKSPSPKEKPLNCKQVRLSKSQSVCSPEREPCRTGNYRSAKTHSKCSRPEYPRDSPSLQIIGMSWDPLHSP